MIKTLATAEKVKALSVEKATLHDMGGTNFEVLFDSRSRVDGFLLKMDSWAFNDYEDALHQFAIIVNDYELELK